MKLPTQAQRTIMLNWLTYFAFGFNPSQLVKAPFLGTSNEISRDTVELTKSTNSDKKFPSMSVMDVFPKPPGWRVYQINYFQYKNYVKNLQSKTFQSIGSPFHLQRSSKQHSSELSHLG